MLVMWLRFGTLWLHVLFKLVLLSCVAIGDCLRACFVPLVGVLAVNSVGYYAFIDGGFTVCLC